MESDFKLGALLSWSSISFDDFLYSCSSDSFVDFISDIKHSGEIRYITDNSIIARPASITRGDFIFSKDTQFIFNSDGSEYLHSYPSLGIRHQRKIQYPKEHNYVSSSIGIPGGGFNHLNPQTIPRFSDNVIPIMLIKNDFNYWHWHFDLLPRLFSLFLMGFISKDSEFVSFFKLRDYQYRSLCFLFGFCPNIVVLDLPVFKSFTYYGHGPF